MSLESLQNGRYQTVRALGSGSMGEVFLVNDTVIGRQVAIKTMRADPTAGSDTESLKDAVRLFKREAQAIARLEHPNILPLFDYGEEKREQTVFTYMVMPYCQEGSLADWIKRNRPDQPLPLEEVVYFIELAADALQYAHEHGIIHQDVKPSNFLLRMHGSGQLLPDILLADFGIARMSSGATITTITTLTAGPRGTPRYMPTEQWEGKPVPASDQYALAVMAYQLLTLKYPFTGDQILQLMYQHLQTIPEPPSRWRPNLSPALDAVILRALAKKPMERFPSVKEFASALHQALKKQQTARTDQRQGSATIESRPTGEIYSTSAPTVPPRAYIPQSTLPLQDRPDAQSPLVLPTNKAFSTPVAPAYTPARSGTTPIQQTVPIPVSSPQSWEPVASQFSPTQPVRPLKAPSHGKAAFFIGLLLFIVLAGTGGTYYYYAILKTQPQNHPHVHASPTPVNPDANPYTNAMSALRFSDPLSKPGMWQSLPYDQLTDGFCLFQQGAYHASSNKTHVYTLCPASPQQQATSDMTFEIHMQILHGDCGGLLLRGDFQQGNFYYFDVCFDGHHYLATYKHFALLQQLPAQTSVLPALQNDSQANITMGVVAQGSLLTFFLNGQQVDQLTDSTYTSGQIALLCFAINNPTEIVFSNARLWTS